jgi:hypothetical protein
MASRPDDDNELFQGDIGEGATAGEGALPCRVLTKDELRRMADRVMVFVKEVETSPGAYLNLYSVSGTLDGRPVKDGLYTGDSPFTRMPDVCASTAEWLEKYAPPNARKP